MNLYVVRHGQVPSNVEGCISGWNNEALTPKGIEQASQIQNQLQCIKIDKIYSSPVYRAMQTAKIIAPQGIEIISDPRLAEREPGNMLGKPRTLINKSEWNALDKDRTSEGAETLLSGLKRVKSFLDEIYVKDENKTVLVVTHNFISKCIWILENHIQSLEQINRFFHSNDEIKYYPGRSAEKDFDGR